MLTNNPIPADTEHFHLTPTMAQSLYIFLNDCGLAEQIAIDKQPDKIKKTLELFNINADFVGFNGSDGYFFKNFDNEVKGQLTNLTKNQDDAIMFFFNKLSPISIINQLVSFKEFEQDCSIETKSQATLTCDPQILECFRQSLAHNPILGRRYYNPYHHQIEIFPTDAKDLTPRHLQILARNQNYNTDGLLRNQNYQGLIDEATQGLICFLVKFTTVSGIVEAHHYGGFPPSKPRVRINPPKPTIILDQAGFQWQDSLFNSGAIFFYPQTPQDPKFSNFQKTAYQAIFNQARPSSPSSDSIEVTWRHQNGNLKGTLDLEAFKKGIAIEYLQAFIGVAWQSKNLPTTKVNFRYLMAGMGFFSSGITGYDENGNYAYPAVINALTTKRLEGILLALDQIKNQPTFDKGQIRALEFPFSSKDDKNTIRLINAIKTKTEEIGLNFIGAGFQDALQPSAEYFIATTNSGDPFAFAGNEGNFESVDGMFPENCHNLQILNSAYNLSMQTRILPNLSASTYCEYLLSQHNPPHQPPLDQTMHSRNISPINPSSNTKNSSDKAYIMDFIQSTIKTIPCPWYYPFEDQEDGLIEIGTTLSTKTKSLTFLDQIKTTKYQLYLEDNGVLKVKKINLAYEHIDLSSTEEEIEVYKLIKNHLMQLRSHSAIDISSPPNPTIQPHPTPKSPPETMEQLLDSTLLSPRAPVVAAAPVEVTSDLMRPNKDSETIIEELGAKLLQNINKIIKHKSSLIENNSIEIDESLKIYNALNGNHYLIFNLNSKSYKRKYNDDINKYFIVERTINKQTRVPSEEPVTNHEDLIKILRELCNKTSSILKQPIPTDEINQPLSPITTSQSSASLNCNDDDHKIPLSPPPSPPPPPPPPARRVPELNLAQTIQTSAEKTETKTSRTRRGFGSDRAAKTPQEQASQNHQTTPDAHRGTDPIAPQPESLPTLPSNPPPSTPETISQLEKTTPNSRGLKPTIGHFDALPEASHDSISNLLMAPPEHPSDHPSTEPSTDDIPPPSTRLPIKIGCFKGLFSLFSPKK